MNYYVTRDDVWKALDGHIRDANKIQGSYYINVGPVSGKRMAPEEMPAVLKNLALYYGKPYYLIKFMKDTTIPLRAIDALCALFHTDKVAIEYTTERREYEENGVSKPSEVRLLIGVKQ